MQKSAGNGLKCENVRETAKSAIPHPPHFIFASGIHDSGFSRSVGREYPLGVIGHALAETIYAA